MNNAIDRDEDLLDAWIRAWDDARSLGRPKAAEELCESRMDLLEELKRRIALNEMMDGLLVDSNALTKKDRGTSDTFSVHSFPILPGFRVVRRIGQGGMSVVYEAVQLSMNRPVALKVINCVDEDHASRSQRLRDEAKALARLNHENIIRVYDVIEGDGFVCLVLEYVDGPDMRQRESGAAMDARAAAEIALTVSTAMTEVHRSGLLHRDIKPANLLQDKRGRVKIGDFGIAKNISTDAKVTVTIDGIGTPSYMAPEQAIGSQSAIGEWTDVYGIGATLYYFLTGRPPHVGATALATMALLQENDPIPPRMLNQAIPRDLETICLKCLEKDSKKRYRTAAALAEDLERFLDGRAISARPLSPVAILGRWCKRNPDRAGLVAACLLGMFGAVALGAWEIIRIHDAATTAEMYRQEVAAALERAQLQEFHVQLGKIKDRSLRRSTGWSWQNLEELKHLSSIRPSGDTESLVELRSEFTKALAAFDARKQRELLPGFDAYTLEFSPTGDVLAVGANADVAGTVSLVLIDTSDWSVSRTLIFPGFAEWLKHSPDGIRSLLFSPDGKELYVGCRSGWIRTFDLELGKEVRSFRAHQNYVNRMKFVDGDQHIVSCSKDGTVLLSSINGDPFSRITQKGELKDIATLGDRLAPHHTNIVVAGENPLWIQAGDFKPFPLSDAERVHWSKSFDAVSEYPLGGGWIRVNQSTFEVVASDANFVYRQFFDGARPSSHHSIDWHSLEISPDGSWLVSSSADSTKLWDLAAYQIANELPSGGHGRVTARFHPRQNLVAISGGMKVSVYELRDKTIWLQRLQQASPLRNMDLMKSGHGVAAVRPWRWQQGVFHHVFAEEAGKFIASMFTSSHANVSFSSDDEGVGYATMDAIQSVTKKNQKMNILCTDLGGRAADILVYSPDGNSLYFTTTGFSSDGNRNSTGEIRIVDLKTPESRQLFLNQESEERFRTSRFLSLSVGKTFLVASSADKSVRIFNAADGTVIAKIDLENVSDTVSLAQDELRAVVGTRTGDLHLVDVPSGQIQQTMRVHDDAVTAVTFAGPDMIVSGSRDKTLKLWTLKNGSMSAVLTLTPLSAAVKELRASTDGNVVAVLVEDETAIRILKLDVLRDNLQESGLEW